MDTEKDMSNKYNWLGCIREASIDLCKHVKEAQTLYDVLLQYTRGELNYADPKSLHKDVVDRIEDLNNTDILIKVNLQKIEDMLNELHGYFICNDERN